MELARLAITTSKSGAVSPGALTLTDDRLFHLEIDPQEFARIQDAEAKIDELTQKLGRFADIVKSTLDAALTQARDMAESFQRGVPVEQVEMELKGSGLHVVINTAGKPLDLNAGQWKYDKQEAEKFIQTLDEMKKGSLSL